MTRLVTHPWPLTGAELQAYRKAARLTQMQLAQAAGIGRHAVIHWEQKAQVIPWRWVPGRMLETLGIRIVSQYETCSRAGAIARVGVLLRPLNSSLAR